MAENNTNMAELEPAMTTDLPPDIVFSNILPRLPAKCVSRFKCVSKRWHSFLTSPAFRKMHLRHVISNQKLLLLTNKRPWVFCTMDCESPENGITASRPVPFKVKCFHEISIVSSLHGMVCVSLSKPADNSLEHSDLILSDLVLWNPSTGDYKTLSKTGFHKDCYKRYYRHQFGLYYCSSKDDYNLVCVTEHPNVNVYIYSLKSDSWRKVESTGGYSNLCVEYQSMRSVFFNEKLYFLVYSVNPASTSCALMTFDTQTEKLSRDIIATPSFGGCSCMFLMVVRDCIHMCVAIGNCIAAAGKHDGIELWRMDGDGDWNKVETCFLKEDLDYQPLHFMRNGNWVMYSRSKERIYVLDSEKQTVDFMGSICIDSFYLQGKYTENIVSPNQYLNFTDDLDQEDGDVEDDLKDKKYRWNIVPGFNLFAGAFMFLYSHLSNWTRQIISLFV